MKTINYQKKYNGSVLSFRKLGISEEVAKSAVSLGWIEPSIIQKEIIPQIIGGKDVIGLALTGSGKTGAFALPIIQKILEKPQAIYALIVLPSRELSLQIVQEFNKLGLHAGITCCSLVGGEKYLLQTITLARKPHILVGTPGRIVDHICHTEGFDLDNLKHFVIDEADRLLDMDFEKEIDQIMNHLPKQRNIHIFSATLTKRMQKLERTCLKDSIRVELSHKYQTVNGLKQEYLFTPFKYKDCYLTSILKELINSNIMVFVKTCVSTKRVASILNNSGFNVTSINGQMTQIDRLRALNEFKTKRSSVLVATDLVSRGLDFMVVDLVINFDTPLNPKTYVHRVGRTARAGRSGRAITLVSQYDIEIFQNIEKLLGKKMKAYPHGSTFQLNSK